MKVKLNRIQRSDKYAGEFLKLFPLQIFGPRAKKISLSEYIRRTSLDFYEDKEVKEQEDFLKVAKILSRVNPTRFEKKRVEKYLSKRKVDYGLVEKLSVERVIQILSTGYMKPFHTSSDTSSNFVKNMVQLRLMEKKSITKAALEYVQKWSKGPSVFEEYLKNPEGVQKKWKNLNITFNIPKEMMAKVISYLTYSDMENFRKVTKKAADVKEVYRYYPMRDIRPNPNMVKKCVETVTMYTDFNYPLLMEMPNLRRINIVSTTGYKFIDEFKFPKSVTELSFEGFVSITKMSKIIGKVHSLSELSVIRCDYDIEIKEPEQIVLPQSLKKLVTEAEFFDKIGRKLPNSLTHLTFGDRFNEKIEPGVIPESVTHLTFGDRFNQMIEPGVLPKSLTHLTFGSNFNNFILIGVIPNSVTHLTFGESFDLPLNPGVIPNSVTHLTFGERFDQSIEPGVIPDSVTHLTFGQMFDKPLSRGSFPNSLTHLTFGGYFNQWINRGVLPDSLTHLKFGTDFNQVIMRGCLPSQLKVLEFGYSFNKPIDKVLPESITHLTFGKRFSIPFKYRDLPNNLVSLNLKRDWNIRWAGPLSQQPFILLEQYLNIGVLPWSLKELKMFDKSVF